MVADRGCRERETFRGIAAAGTANKLKTNTKIKMKTTHSPFEIITARRTAVERFRDSYSMLRVAISRMMRGDKPRFKHLLFN